MINPTWQLDSSVLRSQLVYSGIGQNHMTSKQMVVMICSSRVV